MVDFMIISHGSYYLSPERGKLAQGFLFIIIIFIFLFYLLLLLRGKQKLLCRTFKKIS